MQFGQAVVSRIEVGRRGVVRPEASHRTKIGGAAERGWAVAPGSCPHDDGSRPSKRRARRGFRAAARPPDPSDGRDIHRPGVLFSGRRARRNAAIREVGQAGNDARRSMRRSGRPAQSRCVDSGLATEVPVDELPGNVPNHATGIAFSRGEPASRARRARDTRRSQGHASAAPCLWRDGGPRASRRFNGRGSGSRPATRVRHAASGHSRPRRGARFASPPEANRVSRPRQAVPWRRLP